MELLDQTESVKLFMRRPLAGQSIAIDGKTLRGAHDAGQRAPHLLSAILHEEAVVIAQLQVEEKPTRFPNFRNYWPLCRWKVHSLRRMRCILRPSRPATLSSRRRRITCSSSKRISPPCIKISAI